MQQPLLYDNRLFVLHSKASLEAIDTAARVYQLLLSGEERMALRANFHADVLLCGACVNHIAASASNGRLFIFRMNCFLHSFHLFRHNRIINIGIISYWHSNCKQFSAVFFKFNLATLNLHRNFGLFRAQNSIKWSAKAKAQPIPHQKLKKTGKLS